MGLFSKVWWWYLVRVSQRIIKRKGGRRGVDQKISVSEEQTSLPKLFSGSGVSWPNTLPRVLQPASRLSTSLGPSLAISFAQILV
jgi:hypothetical protein